MLLCEQSNVQLAMVSLAHALNTGEVLAIDTRDINNGHVEAEPEKWRQLNGSWETLKEG